MTLLPHGDGDCKSLIEVSPSLEQLRIYYPRGCQTVSYSHECKINGASFLSELVRVGFEWVVRGRTLHLTHPAADYEEA